MATFTKLRSGEWGIRVEGQARVGETVTVTKRNGETSSATITKVVWSGNGVALCAISEAKAPSTRSTSNRGGWRTSNAAPHGRRCPECGERGCTKAWDAGALCDED